MPTNANSARATQGGAPAAATNAAPAAPAAPVAETTATTVVPANAEVTNNNPANAAEGNAPEANAADSVELVDNGEVAKQISIIDKVKLLIKAGQKITVYNRKVRNNHIEETETYPRMSFTLDTPVKGMIADPNDPLALSYVQGETKVIFTSAWSVISTLSQNEDYSFLIEDLRNDMKLLHYMLADANIMIAQRHFEEDEVVTNLFNDKEIKAYGHEVFINDVIKITLGKVGMQMLKIQKLKASGVSLNVMDILG